MLLAFFISVFPLLKAQGNLKAEYYNGINFEKYVGTEYVSNIDFYWDQEAPIKGLEQHNCSVRYTGQLKTPRTGIVSFHAWVDDGIEVWIDEKLIISNWQLNDTGYSEGQIYLKANTSYSIKINYFNALNEAELKLSWKLPEDPNRSWFNKLWYGNDPKIISSKYFVPAITKTEVFRA